MPDAELSELDDVLLREYFGDVRHLPYPERAEERARLLVNLGFATRHAGHVVPTVAGLLEALDAAWARAGAGEAG